MKKTDITNKKDAKNKSLPAIVHIILNTLVLLILVARVFRADYNSAFLCLLTLFLFNLPLLIDRTFKVKLPDLLHVIILLFIFASEILGELGSFFTYVPWWDTMLHTTTGFLMAAIGFALIDVLNNSPKMHIRLTPFFVAFVAFCFSMTVGVMWEFFEYGVDTFAKGDMQKDSIVTEISSVALNPSGKNEKVRLGGISKTVVTYEGTNGPEECIIENGYLDIGIKDTMEDLMVNCIGAVVFSVVGYFYISGRDKTKIAKNLIPQMKTEEEIREDKEALEKIKKQKKRKR